MSTSARSALPLRLWASLAADVKPIDTVECLLSAPSHAAMQQAYFHAWHSIRVDIAMIISGSPVLDLSGQDADVVKHT